MPRAYRTDAVVAGGIPRLRAPLNPLRSLAWAVLPFIFPLGGSPVAAQGVAQIRFIYENPKLQPQKYVVTVGEDGNGHFRSEGDGPSDGQSVSPELLDRPIHISKALRDSMFAT